jgi:AmiR/NasT family two-component response regulator
LEHLAELREAQSIVAVQANCSMDDALARMKSTALATGETLEQIARGVVSGQVRFDLST